MEEVRAALRLLRDRCDPELRRRRVQFAALNRTLPANRFALRRDAIFGIDSAARESVEYFATRSKEMCREMDSFLAETAGRARLLDIGALHGVFSLAFTASREGGRALAVEPSPDARAILRRNVALNESLAIEVSEVALGRSEGQIRMRQNWQHLEALGEGESAQGEREVPVQSADGLCAGLGFVPDVLKIDVEGFEGEVLAGATRLLEARPLIFLELHPKELPKFGSSATAILEALQARRYRIQPIGRRLPADEARMRLRNSLRIVAVPA